jgi:hypothetical protein
MLKSRSSCVVRRATAAIAALAALVVAFAGQPGSAAASTKVAAVQTGTPGDPLSYLTPQQRPALQGLLANGDSVRAAIGSGSYEAAISAVLAASGAAPPATPALPVPTSRDVARVAALPASLRQPVAGLWAAVRAASQALGRISIAELRDELSSIDASLASYPQRALAAYSAAPSAGPSLGTGATGPLQVGSSPGSGGLARTDMLAGQRLRPATLQAMQQDPAQALLLGAALDRYIPTLLAARGTMPAPVSNAVDGCDLLDQTPYICVGSAADNVYTQDESLLIDLGGNNSYGNGAGAAPFVPAGATAAQPVSLNLDLGGGTDTYAAPASSLTAEVTGGTYPGLVLGQGASVLGGLGLSVNLSGDDSYTAQGLPTPAPGADTPAPEAIMIAQGATLDGGGFLFDGGGSDTFRATSPRLTQSGRPFDYAQGAAILGNAALVERGGGNSVYAISAGGYHNPTPQYSFTTVMGQGMAYDGANALLYDEGGTDSFRVSTGSATGGVSGGPLAGNPNFQVAAQGYADEGTALLLEGSGSHSYHIGVTMLGSGSAMWGVEGQGVTDFVGNTLLQDKGGPNTYDIEASLRHTETKVVDDSCGCASASYAISGGAGDSPGSLDAGNFAPVNVRGQGAVSVGVAALDNAGPATYRAVSNATMSVTLRDQLTAPSAAASLSVHGYLSPDLMAQGSAEFGYPNETQTEAFLINRSGHATYAALTSDAVKAKATSANGPRPQVSAQSSFQWMRTPGAIGGQGANVWNADIYNGSLGALLDLGGPGDVLSAQQTDTVTTSPNSGRGVAPGGFWPPFQGAGDGGLLVVAGTSPQITASPANGICPQSSPRGFGAWVACDDYTTSAVTDPDQQSWDFLGGSTDPGHAAGYAPGSIGAQPQLTLSAPSSAYDDSAIPLTATLRDAANTVLPHAPLHFSLQGALPVGPSASPDAEVQWLTLGQVDAVTNAQGVATAKLPLALLAVAGGEPSNLRIDGYRIMATFDGASGLYPHHVVSAISIMDGPPPGS